MVLSNGQGSVTSAMAQVTLILPPAGHVAGFPVAAGANNQVTASYGLPDGRVLIGGQSFSSAGASGNNTARTHLALLNTDGTVDANFNPSPSGSVTAILPGDSGTSVVIGGSFATIAGTTVNGLAKLNLDGTLDTSFTANLGAGFTYFGGVGQIYDVIRLPSGQYLVGGVFNSVGGNAINGLARINANGSVDTTFKPFASGFPQIYDIDVLADGRYVLGGTFSLGGKSNLAIMASSGAVDANFTANFQFGVNKVAVTTDSHILAAGGPLGTLNGNSLGNLVKLSLTGEVNAPFAAAVGVINSTIYSLAIQANGRIIVGGGFSSFG